MWCLTGRKYRGRHLERFADRFEEIGMFKDITQLENPELSDIEWF